MCFSIDQPLGRRKSGSDGVKLRVSHFTNGMSRLDWSRVVIFGLSVSIGLFGFLLLGPVGFLSGLALALVVGLYVYDINSKRTQRIDEFEKRVTELENTVHKQSESVASEDTDQ